MAVINDDYTIGIKREMVTALQPMFGNDFPIDNLANRVYVGLEYPLTDTRYPAIYLTYNENELRSAGVGHVEDATGPDGTPAQVKHWYFTGSINFNILALSPKERDQLGAALVNILAFGETNDFLNTFRTQLMNSTYVDLQYLQEIIHPGGEQVGNPPWESETDIVFGKQYSIDVLGEFYSNIYTGDLVQIDHVQVHPYTDQGSPWW